MTTSKQPADQAQANSKRFTFAPQNASAERPMEQVLAKDRKRRNLRFLLMIGTSVIAAVVLSFVSLTSEEDIKVQVSAKLPQLAEAVGLELKGITFKGITSEGAEFIVWAESAREAADDPNLVKLTAPRARVDSNIGNPITLRSNEGQFDRDNDRISFNGRVVIIRPDLGYTLRTETAVAHLDRGVLTSDQQVFASSPRVRVQAEGMVIGEDGEDVLFTGKTTLTIRQLNRALSKSGQN